MSEIRIKLERVDLCARVLADPLLKSSELVRLLGSPFLKHGVAHRYKARAALFQQSDPGDSLFFVLSGDVRLYASADHEGAELGTLVAGDVIGESEVLAGQGPRSCSAIAQDEVEAVELPRPALVPHLAQLAGYLEGLNTARHAKLKEMTDFLNRW